MLFRPVILLGILISAVLSVAGVHADYAARGDVTAFIDEMVEEHGFERSELEGLMAAAERQQGILDAIARPAERVLTWGAYRDIFLDEDRIRQGVEFWTTHADALARAEAELGVAPEIVVAIIGVETRYGRNKGRWRVMDALTTLAFDYPPRSSFFRRELKEFLLLVREEERPALDLMGSYAGAMGYGQFIPSSYRAYAIDFTGNAQRDIWDNPTDAIGSVANYLRVHGWRDGEEITRPVTLGSGDTRSLINSNLRPDTTVGALRGLGVDGLDGLPETGPATLLELEAHAGTRHFVGLQNFAAITRYNHSRLYGMAVYDLSQAILLRRMEAMEAGTDG